MTAHKALSPARLLAVTIGVASLGLASVGLIVSGAGAAQGPIDLGTAGTFAVLAGSTVTNTGPSVVSGDLGVFPGSAVTGFTGPPNGTVVNGTVHATDGPAQTAQSDLTTAYNQAAGQTPCTDETGKVLGQDVGTVATPLLPGVYCFSSSAQLTGSLHLSGAGVYVFQIGTTLTTAPGSSVVLDNSASACDIFWQVGSSATIDTTTQFVGTAMANASITVNDGAVIEGRLLVRTGQVSLINDTITAPMCAVTTTSTAPGATTTTVPGATTTTTGPGATTTTAPGATTTTLPGATTTTLPGATTTTTGPGATTTTAPGATTTTMPGATTTLPGATTTLPGATTTTTNGRPSGATTTTTSHAASTTTNTTVSAGSGTLSLTGGGSDTTGPQGRPLARTGTSLSRVVAIAIAFLILGAVVVAFESEKVAAVRGRPGRRC